MPSGDHLGMKRLRSSLSHAIARVRGSACSGATADRGPDGLPLLPWHLTYQTHYDPKEHCPVCSLGEGEAHEPGKTQSHAAHYMALPPPPQPALTSVDEHGLKLMMSLQRPRGWPTWWGPQRAELQARCARALESTPLHWTIIALTVFDLGIVVTEMVLSSIYPAGEHIPHGVHTAEEALSWTSIAILGLFVLELAARLAVWGPTYFTQSWWHCFDALVIVTSLTLELTLKGIAQEVASLLIFFRLWRILRVMHGVAEAMELNHEKEQEQHHRLIHGLQRDLVEEHRRVRALEREVAALSGAAAGAGVDVSAIMRLAAAAASQPDLLQLQAEAEDAAPPATAAGQLNGHQPHEEV